MNNDIDVQQIIGANLVGGADERIGKIGQVFLDDRTGAPEWVTVQTGLFGTKENFVPLNAAQIASGDVRVPYTKDQITSAPNVDADGGHLSESEEAELYRYYGLEYATQETGVQTGQVDESAAWTGREEHPGAVGHDTSGPTTDEAMTRSEERLRAGTERVTTGRARLRKYIVTEQQQVTVPVSREEVRIEREPITDANVGAAMAGPDLSEEEHEVVLMEERPVVATETVPVERVRLAKDVQQSEETVTADVRKERIETDLDEGIDRR
jgi:uncharacterized protein (TIGR02271 family)